MSNRTIYIDETGSHGFTNLDDNNSFYIISAVEIKTEYLDSFKLEYDKIVNMHQDSNFLKSTTLKKLYNNQSQRKKVIQIIESLVELNFKTYSIVIDKRNITESSGLMYREPFYKSLHKILYDNIFRHNNDIDFISDSFGDEDFQVSFKNYLSKQKNESPLNLFNNINIKFVNKDKYVQIADWISGIIRSKLIGEEFGDFYESIREKEIFCFIIPSVLRLSFMMYASFPRSSAISAISAVSRAVSEPATPMAMPIVAEAKAGASLTPSPTMAISPTFVNSSIILSFSSGRFS